VSDKERVSAWDLIEGCRGGGEAGVGPRWSLFQAQRVDQQPETALAQLNRLVPHDHFGQTRRPALPLDSRPDPFLQPPMVQYDPVKLQELERGAGLRNQWRNTWIFL